MGQPIILKESGVRLELLMAAEVQPPSKPTGRGKNPKSIAALSRKGKGRPALPKGEGKTAHTLTFSEEEWTGLKELAASAEMSISSFLGLLGANKDILQASMQQLTSADTLHQLNLTPDQLMEMPLVELLNQLSLSKKTEES